MMKTDVGDVELLEQAVLTEARDEAEHILAEARAKADAILKRAQEQAETERKTILNRAQQDADRIHRQVLATAQLKARSVELEQREKLLEDVFAEARSKLDSIRKRPDFDAFAARLLREALAQLRVTQAQIRADEASLKALKKGALDALARELHGEFTLGAPLEEGTGVVVDAADGKLHYDNTLATRLSRLQSGLRSAVYKVLTGEKV
jgi:V/A-type H+/Na+-transporting ATPase subunit E